MNIVLFTRDNRIIDFLFAEALQKQLPTVAHCMVMDANNYDEELKNLGPDRMKIEGPYFFIVTIDERIDPAKPPVWPEKLAEATKKSYPSSKVLWLFHNYAFSDANETHAMFPFMDLNTIMAVTLANPVIKAWDVLLNMIHRHIHEVS